MTAPPVDLDDYLTSMLRAADRLANAMRTEDPDLIGRYVDEALHVPAPPGAPAGLRALIYALAVQVDTDVPWRERFAWTFDIAAVAGRPADPGPSSGSYVSQSAALDPVTWGAAPSSSTKAAA